MSYTLAVLTPRVLFQPLLVMMSCVDQYCMLFCLLFILSHFYPPSLSFFEQQYNRVPFFNFNPLYFLHSPSSSTTVLATASSSLLLLPLLLRVLWASSSSLYDYYFVVKKWQLPIVVVISPLWRFHTSRIYQKSAAVRGTLHRVDRCGKRRFHGKIWRYSSEPQRCSCDLDLY